jgi:hypothetical protein
MACGQFQQDLRSDVVRQVANHRQRLRGSSGSRGKLEMEHVLLNDSDIRFATGWEFGPQMSRQSGVELHSNNMLCPRCKGSGNSACSGPNFNHRASAQITKGRSNAVNSLRVVEKVLSESGFDGHGLL